MKNKKRVLIAFTVGMLAFAPIIGYTGSAITAYASSIDNDFSSGDAGKTRNSTSRTTTSNNSGNTNSLGSVLDGGTVSEDDKAMSDFLGQHRGVTSEQLNTASEVASPVTNAFGYIAAVIVALPASAIFLITALDLLYISVPFLRPYLYTAGTDGTGATTAGRYGGGPGGYGGYGGYSQSTPSSSGRKRHQLISDEAVACVALLGGSSRTENIGAPGQRSNETRGSVIKAYLIKRAGFMVLFVICVVILMSSALMGTGANLANFGIKVITAVNNMLKSYFG